MMLLPWCTSIAAAAACSGSNPRTQDNNDETEIGRSNWEQSSYSSSFVMSATNSRHHPLTASNNNRIVVWWRSSLLMMTIYFFCNVAPLVEARSHWGMASKAWNHKHLLLLSPERRISSLQLQKNNIYLGDSISFMNNISPRGGATLEAVKDKEKEEKDVKKDQVDENKEETKNDEEKEEIGVALKKVQEDEEHEVEEEEENEPEEDEDDEEEEEVEVVKVVKKKKSKVLVQQQQQQPVDDTSSNSQEGAQVEAYDEPFFVSPMMQLYTTFGMMLIFRKLDIYKPKVVRVARFAFISYVVVLQLFVFYVRIRAKLRNDRTPITTTNPFAGLLQQQFGSDANKDGTTANTSPPSSPGGDLVKNLASSFLSSSSTILEYDLSQARNLQGGLLFNMAFMWFLHFKMEQIQPLLIQAATGLMTLVYHPLFQLYVMGRNLERPFKQPVNPRIAGLTNTTTTTATATDETEEVKVVTKETDDSKTTAAAVVAKTEEKEEDSEEEEFVDAQEAEEEDDEDDDEEEETEEEE